MEFKRLYTSSKTYIVLLVVAIAILLFTATMAYRQIKRMQKSAEMVAHTLLVNNAISLLSAHYTKAESEEFRKEILKNKTSNTTYDKYLAEGQVIMDSIAALTTDNSSQRKRLLPMSKLLDTLNSQLLTLNVDSVELKESLKLQKLKINSTLYHLRTLKSEMLAEEQLLLKGSKAEYDSSKYLAPLTSLVLGFIALFVFGISFRRIYSNKLKIRKSEAFLQSVLATTNNIVNYYEPILDEQGNVEDFIISFANDCNRDYLDLDPEKLIGKRISQIFPYLQLNGEFDEMVRCYRQQERADFDRKIVFNGKKMWFHSIVTPLAEGILVTIRNSTAEEESKQEQLVLNQRLLVQNENLTDVRDFLSKVLASSDNVIRYFTPIYNHNQDVVDFNMIFNNDNISSVLAQYPADLENKLLSEVLPLYFENGVFEIFVECLKNRNDVRFEKRYKINGKQHWFKTTVVILDKGILTTSVDTTSEKRSELNLSSLNRQLEDQNVALIDGRAFLTNIFQSISHVIMHLKSIRNEEGNIIDFEIQFINEQINTITGDISKELKNKKVSDVFPSVFESGAYEHLIDAIDNDRVVEYEVPFEGDGQKKWFKATAIKLDDGVTVTTIEITEDKKRSEELTLLNEELKTQNAILNDAESIAKIGSYHRYLDSDEANLSSNFFHILGEEPSSLGISINQLRNFVHPDDYEHYDRIHNETSKTTKTDEDIYRIITKLGETKHIYVSSQNYVKFGRRISIGIVQDITEQIKKDENLRARNLELKRSNAELEAFNRVASHDLQEPLRKIQLFISRISGDREDELSEKKLSYFIKIDNAAKRMQSLILNLLTYSQIESKNQQYQQVDLNEVLEKVKDDLYSTITETGARIKTEKLPIIKGLPYQLEQLFSNLISNAIKYRSINKVPHVNLQSEKVHQKQIPEDFFKTEKYYYKITIGDNGIGFIPEHAEKIFEVFQRLHQKSEYSGTGIGLAICKKIVENHRGFIYATSEPGLGSAFIIYLPA